jgi:hypothetical protein
MGIIKLIFVALLVFVGFFLLKKFRKPVNTIVQQPSTNKMVLRLHRRAGSIPAPGTILKKRFVEIQAFFFKQTNANKVLAFFICNCNGYIIINF